jgi:hypothetical protein
MNPFIANLFRQAASKAPAVGFGRVAPKFSKIVKDATNPSTYADLARRAEQTLGGRLPSQFSGTRFGNIPTQAVGLLSDLAEMPMGMARTARAIPTSGAIREMAEGSTRIPSSIQQAGSGALRAPGIPGSMSRGPVLTAPASTAVRQGGPFGVDFNLRRQLMKAGGGSLEGVAKQLVPTKGNTNALANIFKTTRGLKGAAGLLGLTPGGVVLNEGLNLVFPPPAKGGLPVGTVGANGRVWGGDDYGWQSVPSALKAGLITEDQANMATPGRLPGGRPGPELPSSLQSSAGLLPGGRPGPELPSSLRATGGDDLAQDQENSRVAQLTEQDPLFKKYRIADLTKAYNTASTPEEKERIGLEIWATTNPGLAKQLKPGQTGYQEATSTFLSQGPLGGYQRQMGDVQFIPSEQAPQGLQSSFQMQTPLTGLNVPTVGPIGASESFAQYTPNMKAFIDPMQFVSPAERSQVEKSLIRKAFESRLK